LWLLTALFAFRVVAQPLSAVVHLPILPPFESWHSDTLPYPMLLASQLVILAALAWTTTRLAKGTVSPRRSEGGVAMAIGSLYFASMSARLVLGLTVLEHHRWFASPVPTLFHLALAAWLWLYGRFHWVHGPYRQRHGEARQDHHPR
jgi:hypothetical protein